MHGYKWPINGTRTRTPHQQHLSPRLLSLTLRISFFGLSLCFCRNAPVCGVHKSVTQKPPRMNVKLDVHHLCTRCSCTEVRMSDTRTVRPSPVLQHFLPSVDPMMEADAAVYGLFPYNP